MWTYMGEVASSMSQTDTTLNFGANTAGWVVCQETGRHARSWSVETPGPAPLERLDLLCSGEDSRLLLACTRAGLGVWAVGARLLAAHLRFMILHRVAIWHLGAQPPAASSVPPHVGAAVCKSTAAEVFSAWWGTPVQSPNVARHRPVVVHPMAHQRLSLLDTCLPANEEGRRDILSGSVFVAQQEEGARTCSTTIYCPTAARLGSSELQYVYPSEPGLRGVVTPVSPALDNHRGAPGALVVGDRPHVLLGIVALLCLVDSEDSTATTLIVAPRHIFPSAARIVGGAVGPARFRAVATLKDLRETNVSALPPVVLTSLELTQSHSPFGPRRRVCILGWPHSSDVLRRSRVRLGAQFTVAFALASEVDGAMMPNRHAAMRAERLGDLLSMPPSCLSDACALQQVFESRVHRLGVPPLPSVGSLRYAVVAAPRLSDTEAKRGAGLVEPARSRAMLLGPLYGPGGPFPWVPHGEGDAVAAHFRRSSPSKASRADAFAETSYRSEPPRDHCPICFDPDPTTVTLCGHWFCGDCLLPALETVPVCPLCKSPTDLHVDVVSVGRPVVAPQRTAYLDFLGRHLEHAPLKSVVLCSHGELHEKLASALRSRGVRAAAWSGNARQVHQNCETFCREEVRCCLLVDPATLSISWLARLPPVGHIYVMAPLLSLKRPCCCQLRDVFSVFRGEDGLPAPLSFICRSEDHLPQTPFVGCGHTGGCLQLLRAT